MKHHHQHFKSSKLEKRYTFSSLSDTPFSYRTHPYLFLRHTHTCFSDTLLLVYWSRRHFYLFIGHTFTSLSDTHLLDYRSHLYLFIEHTFNFLLDALVLTKTKNCPETGCIITAFFVNLSINCSHCLRISCWSP